MRRELDARYLLCPMPVIRVQQAVETLGPGDVLDIRATDPGALHDIPAWCRVHGHEVLHAATEAGEIRISLRVQSA